MRDNGEGEYMAIQTSETSCHMQVDSRSNSALSNEQTAVSATRKNAHGGGFSLTGFLLLVANITYWMCAGAYTPFLSSYFTSIGLSATEVGVLLTISPLAIIFIQPLWARLSDATGKRKLVLGFLAAASAAAALLYYVGTSYLTVLIATIVFVLFFSALLPLCDALVIQSCNDFGVEFAHVRMGGTTGYAFVVFIVGLYLDRAPQAQFIVVTALSLVFLAAVIALPQARRREGARTAAQDESSAAEAAVEKPPAQPQATSIVRFASDRPVLGIFRTQEIFFILAFAFVSQMGLGFSGSFLGRYVVELGYGQSLVGVLSAVSALSELPILLFSHKLVNRFGVMRLLAFSCVMMVARLVLIGMGTVTTMVAGQLLQSVTYMTVYYCCTRYAAEAVLPGKLSQGQSVFVLVQSGLAMMVANLAGGAIGDTLGMRASYFLSAGLVLVSTFVVLVAYRAWRASISHAHEPTAASVSRE